MNHWKETAEILSRLAELRAAGRRAALATVVRIVGSAYRRPGAKFLIEENGETLGSVSGGCLEADVREVAKAVMVTGAPSLRHYSTGTDEDIVWGLGLGCNGLVDVFIQPATEGPLAEMVGRLRELLAGDSTFAIATVLDGDEAGATDVAAAEGALPGVQTIGDRQVFVEVLPPPPHLIVCGAGDDARPLVAYAADAGFRVTLVDHRQGLMQPSWFPQAARLILARPEEPIDLPSASRSLAVVKTHSLNHDREWVRRLLAAGLPYIGVLGPRARTENILREIGREGDERVYGPVGLDLGADGPRQVALAIVAELLAFTAQREPRHLSERREAIHAG
ncbi:MAG TPA: XdhC family protein [Thermoanaerobaculia bacterium]|jgi:xanthine/CO dehydrogenase XdhC/CoxF family maturation factor|nr:XdhC family protein [Thermoanaerobaculia bacterium]